jgi:antibiotic biosynthesis monooxygenase (ABM) superfamily enzyme
MVGPIPSTERDSLAFRVKVVFSVVIGLSAGLITLQGDVSLAVTALVTLLGLVFGVLLTWFVIPGSGETVRESRRR